MAWIRADELQGQEILDEVEVLNTVYVKVADDKDNRVAEKELVAKNTERRNRYGLHAGIRL